MGAWDGVPSLELPVRRKGQITKVILSNRPSEHRNPAELARELAYNEVRMKATKSLTIESIDVDNDGELDALMSYVLAEGDKIYQAQREEALRLGIIDEQGRLLKRELPEDMRADAGTDFGG